ASYCIHNFENSNSNTRFQFSSFTDNYYSADGFVGAVNPNHGTTNCFNDQTLPLLLNHLQLQSGNNDTLSLNIRGYTLSPDFVNPAQHNFHLNNTSPLIDKGVIVNNISDITNLNYYGNKPDIGAFENNSVVTSLKDKVLMMEGFAVFPNPTTGSVTINATNKSNGTKLIIRNVLGEQINRTETLNSSNTSIFIEGSSGVYFLELIPETGQSINFKLIKN
ncbi:MAG: T9SS type A sorting domain-containing protein, partial [Bacteroidia bacterium]|nr:T9SS type A sorting domain-containing protein [Bacteroidia bacterium]